MSNYNLTQLESKEMTELKQIAAELELKVSNSASQQQLVYDILDRQAVVNSQNKAAKEKNNPAKGKRSRVSLKKNPEQKVMTATGKNTVQSEEPQKKIMVEQKKVVKKAEPEIKTPDIATPEVPVDTENSAKAKQVKKRPTKKAVKATDKVAEKAPENTPIADVQTAEPASVAKKEANTTKIVLEKNHKKLPKLPLNKLLKYLRNLLRKISISKTVKMVNTTKTANSKTITVQNSIRKDLKNNMILMEY